MKTLICRKIEFERKTVKRAWVIPVALIFIHLVFGSGIIFCQEIGTGAEVEDSRNHNAEISIPVEPTITSVERQVLKVSAGLIKEGNVLEAIELLDSLDSENAALEFVIGNLKSTQGDREESIRNYEKAIDLFPNFQRAYRENGVVLVDLGYFEEGRKNLAKSLELGGRNGKGYGYLAKANFNLGEYSAAEIYFRKALEFEPEKEDWLSGLESTSTALRKYNSQSWINAASSSIYEADEVSVLPIIYEMVDPKYPYELLKDQIEGVVVLRVFLDENGRLITGFTEKSDYPDFSSSAIKSILNSKFKPALLDGGPVKVSFTVKVEYRSEKVSISIPR